MFQWLKNVLRFGKEPDVEPDLDLGDDDLATRTLLTDEQFLVICPSVNMTSAELVTLGEKLRHWQSAHRYAQNIVGLDDLLNGRMPQTRAFRVGVPFIPDRVDTCNESVALLHVARGIDHVRAANSLSKVLGKPKDRLAIFVSASEYSAMTR